MNSHHLGAVATQETEAYSGAMIMRPTLAIEACTYGSWTVRAGYATGRTRRPSLGCQDTFAVAAFDGWLLVALSSAPNGADEGLIARLWVHDAVDAARNAARPAAGPLLRTVLQGRPSATDDSLLVAVLPGSVPHAGRVRGTVALHGRRASTWLVTGGVATTGARSNGAAELPIEVNDGEIWCATTSGRASELAAVWGFPPTPAEFMAHLANDTGTDRAMVALWAGHCAGHSP